MSTNQPPKGRSMTPQDYEIPITQKHPALKKPNTLVNQATSSIHMTNRFHSLSQFPPLKFSDVVQSSTSKSPSKINSNPSSSKTPETHSYFTKHQVEHIHLTTKYKEVPEISDLKRDTAKLFPEGCQWFPDNNMKTRKFYELILVDSKSVDLTHEYDSKNPQYVSYSKCLIKKILPASDWISPYTQMEFTVNYNPGGYTYYDYQMAWHKAFLFRPFNHSWFFRFCPAFLSQIPLWFIEWWDKFGAQTDIYPKIVEEGFNAFVQQSYGPRYSKCMHFHSQFNIPWIFCWSFKYAQYYPKDYPISLIREFKIKWWPNYNTDLCTAAAITKVLNEESRLKKAMQKVPIQVDDNSSSSTSKQVSDPDYLQILDIEPAKFKRYVEYVNGLMQRQQELRKSPLTNFNDDDDDPFGGPLAQDPNIM